MSFSIFSRTVYKGKSEISGEIEVKEQLGQHLLYVQKLIQSGGIVKKIWRKPLKRIKNSKLEIRNCLILGLGGGTIVQLIKLRHPETKFVGVEIDPKIIKIGKKFFGLSKIINLEIINIDAFEWIKTNREKFDLIIVDLYLGWDLPQEVKSGKFLSNIKRLLTKKGVAIFNRLRINKEDLKMFEKKLKKYFSQTDFVKTSSNLFFITKKAELC